MASNKKRFAAGTYCGAPESPFGTVQGKKAKEAVRVTEGDGKKRPTQTMRKENNSGNEMHKKKEKTKGRQ